MKKLISIILSLALVACMFAMNVGAENAIGHHGATGSVADGEDSFTATDFSKDVTLKITDRVSKYAVDIVFGGDSAYENTVGGLTWNVNTLKYELTSTTMADLKYTFTVTNYSDKPVKVAVSDTENNTLLNVAFTNAAFTVAGNKHGTELADVAKDAASAVISPASGTWADTINALLGTDSGSKTVTLATFTVNVSMAS